MYNYFPYIIGMIFIAYLIGLFIFTKCKKKKDSNNSIIRVKKHIIFYRKITIIVVDSHPQSNI